MKTDKIEDLWRRAVYARLEGVVAFAYMNPDEMAAEYNGIGPDSLPEEVRGKLTEWLALFEPAALIHDLRFSQSNGCRQAFISANEEFLENCKRLAKAEYGMFSWKRYRAIAAALVMYECVKSSAGWNAWRDAYEHRISQRKEN